MSILYHFPWTFLITCRPSNAIVIAPSRMLNFGLIYYTIETRLNMPASSLLYESWSLGCPGYVQVVEICCMEYSARSMIIASITQFSL